MQRTVTDRGEIERILGDPADTVATAPPDEAGLAWLGANVCRFTNGAEHARRRALVEAEPARLDPAALRAAGAAPLGAVADAALLVERCYLSGERGRACSTRCSERLRRDDAGAAGRLDRRLGGAREGVGVDGQGL